MSSLAGEKHCLPVGMMISYQKALSDELRQIDGSDVIPKEIATIKPLLQFLHHVWWHVQLEGLENFPEEGPAFIAANTNSYIPWPALMLIYALMMKGSQREVTVLADMDFITDERIALWLRSLNFKSWSYDNAKQLLEQGKVLLVFPEQRSSRGESVKMQNRLRRFDWTKFLPAIETNAPVYPLATLGMEDFKLPGLFKLISLPSPCKMRLIGAVPYHQFQDREKVQDEAKRIALFTEGEIQAEINRQLRTKIRKVR
jgi:1-acyl-sn-glycerol-3-phosphate acyltransferase